MSLQTVFKFKGVTDVLPSKGELGDVWIVGDKEYVWCGEWQELGELSTDEPKEIVKEVVPSTCRKCGHR